MISLTITTQHQYISLTIEEGETLTWWASGGTITNPFNIESSAADSKYTFELEKVG